MSKRILVVDDDNTLRRSISASLKKQGFEVHEFADGEKVLQTVKELKPDLVILDVMLPGSSGFDICYAIKDDEHISSTPVMIITSLTVDATRGDEFWKSMSNADDFVTKPFSMLELDMRIRRLLD